MSGWRDITKGVTVEGEIDFSMPAASHLFILAVPHIGYTHVYSRDQGSVHLRARRADGSLTSEYFGMQACSRDQSSVRIVDFTVPGSNRDRVAVAGMGSGPTGGRIDTTGRRAQGLLHAPPFTCVYSRDDAMNRYFAGKVMSLECTVDPAVPAA